MESAKLASVSLVGHMLAEMLGTDFLAACGLGRFPPSGTPDIRKFPQDRKLLTVDGDQEFDLFLCFQVGVVIVLGHQVARE